jgi:hypothetical protein
MKPKDVERARLWCVEKKAWSVDLQFNPEAGSFKLERRSTWSSERSEADPWGGMYEFEHGDPDSLSFDVLFDQSIVEEPDLADATGFEKALLKALGSLLGEDENDDDVLEDIEKLHRLTMPLQHASKFDLRPPIVAFVWGKLEFMGAVTNVSTEVLAVDHHGKPKRARCSISMEGRAFSGSATADEIVNPKYKAPKASTSARSGKSRDDILKKL